MVTYKTVNKLVERFFAILSGISLCVVFIVSFAQVVQRFVFNMSMPWAPDVTRIFFVYSVLCGMCVGVIRKSHLSIDVFVHALPERVRTALALVSDIIVIVFLVFVFKESFPFIAGNTDQTTPYLNFPMSYVYAAFPVCIAVMLAYLAVDSVVTLKDLFGTRREDK